MALAETLDVFEVVQSVADDVVVAAQAQTVEIQIFKGKAFCGSHLVEPLSVMPGIDPADGVVRTVKEVDSRDLQCRLFGDDGPHFSGEIHAHPGELFQKGVDAHFCAPVVPLGGGTAFFNGVEGVGFGVIETCDEDVVVQGLDVESLFAELFEIQLCLTAPDVVTEYEGNLPRRHLVDDGDLFAEELREEVLQLLSRKAHCARGFGGNDDLSVSRCCGDLLFGVDFCVPFRTQL